MLVGCGRKIRNKAIMNDSLACLVLSGAGASGFSPAHLKVVCVSPGGGGAWCPYGEQGQHPSCPQLRLPPLPTAEWG